MNLSFDARGRLWVTHSLEYPFPTAGEGVQPRDLNQDQQFALAELEKYGWELKFIRRPMFQKPIPVVFDSDRKTYAVLLPDGTLDQKPGFDIRK